ncbi:MAG: flagellar protein export ATPase FliI [Clostridia bacterium]|jgi:flagellum-specific ATP synthase|nr:flagellar protein export ATPase FliI [Clostridia bacterium]MCI1959763.1 flagellar protein export ATPase FliI [Clostridia bacterium]MCI1999911.1 flagellar protein export ATPase FliI [Clostridia bacterium]MCI2014173.1 flagellar protein export ATPase FliI [Clostridia bacterium]
MFSELIDVVKKSNTVSHIGKIENIIGMSIEASSQKASIGEISLIYNKNEKRQIAAETVGFKDDHILLMPYESIKGVSAGTFVKNTNECLKIPVGNFLTGRIVDAMGRPIDGLGDFKTDQFFPVDNPLTNPLERPPIREKMEFGIKAIDGMLTIGKGQRMGIFAGSGVGKSTLLGMIAKNVKTDINVIALVGERGREVREFVEKDLGEEGLKRSVLVVATSDQPAMLRMKCPIVATAIAEYFKNQGKDVLLMMDSLTRFAMAQREIGLAIGEPPIARGYTPSIYAELPKLLERSGNFKEGSITGIYTVLVEGDDTNEPIADTVRSIIDGHIVLSRKLANSNHFPAIDVNASISRLMSSIVSKEQLEKASKLRDILSLYEKNSDLIAIGAYKSGTNHKLDFAISKIDKINEFLMQGVNEKFSYDETLNKMSEILE